METKEKQKGSVWAAHAVKGCQLRFWIRPGKNNERVSLFNAAALQATPSVITHPDARFDRKSLVPNFATTSTHSCDEGG